MTSEVQFGDLCSFVRRKNLPFRMVGDLTVLVDPADDSAILISPMASAAWNEAAEWTSVADLACFVLRSHGPDPTVDLVDAVAACIDDLIEHDLLDTR